MTSKASHRRMATLAVLAMIWSALAVLPAFAAEPTSTATLVTGNDIVAGQQQVAFTIRISYPQSSGLGSVTDPKDPANVVQIVPPRNVITGLESTMEGWDAVRPADSDRLFFTGNEIQPGDTVDFTFTGDTVRPSEDLTRSFKVFLSDDEGETFTQSTDGGLDSLIRVLKVNAVEIISPAGVTDGTASTDQANVGIRVTVENFGSSAGTGRTGLNVESSLQGVSNDGPLSGDILYGASRTFDFTATMPSSPQNITLTGTADATDGNASAKPLAGAALQVVRKFGLAYLSGSLSPRAVVPNGPAYSFSAGFDPTGQVVANLNTASSTFEMSSYSTTLSSPSTVDPDDGSTTLTFDPAVVNLPDKTDPGYSPTVHLTGVDENDAPIDFTFNIGDTVRVDSDIPIVLPDLGGMTSNLDDPDEGEEEVATEGTELDLGGEINNSDGTDCTDCQVNDAWIRYTFANGSTQDVDVTDEISVDNQGNLSGTHAVEIADASVRNAKLFVSAVDSAGNGDQAGVSDPLIVDNVAPAFDGGITGQTPAYVDDTGRNKYRTITVNLRESVKFPAPVGSSAADWVVDSTSVTDAQAYRNDGTETDGHADVVVLTVSSDLDPNQVPQVRYEPGRTSGLDQNRGQDQVSKDLADAIVAIVDGIAPDLADLLEVNDRIDQDGFWSNTTTPSITAGGVAVGDTVRVYDVTDGGQTLIDQKTQQNDSERITLNDDGGYAFNVEHGDVVKIAIEVLDEALNSSGLAEFDIEFDFVAPTVASLAQSGRDVTVTMDEPLSADPDFQGSNSASDWAAEQGSGFFAQTYAATDVAHGSGSPDITVTYEEDAGTVELDRVIYEFLNLSGNNTRYEDRAGNPLQNFTADFGA